MANFPMAGPMFKPPNCPHHPVNYRRNTPLLLPVLRSRPNSQRTRVAPEGSPKTIQKTTSKTSKSDFQKKTNPTLFQFSNTFPAGYRSLGRKEISHRVARVAPARLCHPSPENTTDVTVSQDQVKCYTFRHYFW